jgi:hypothetical protein
MTVVVAVIVIMVVVTIVVAVIVTGVAVTAAFVAAAVMASATGAGTASPATRGIGLADGTHAIVPGAGLRDTAKEQDRRYRGGEQPLFE